MSRSPFHLVEVSPWPIMAAFSAFLMTSGTTIWLHSSSKLIFSSGLLLMILCAAQWWRDVTREASFAGFHTNLVSKGMRMGMILFILSEIMFFMSFFWAFFHSSLVPNNEIGCIWPPMGINIINPFGVPLLNTAVLLASGATISWSHHNFRINNKNNASLALMMTIMLGMFFTYLQATEYMSTSFSISDSVYGTTFFITTGFHGTHVIIGSMILMVMFYRNLNEHFSSTHHVGFEVSAWYWHFVDVVWICLYLSMYWWGS
uniref:Cytochrome c oxidase subunit 3 n=1 Tax=Paracanthobdella livanowi TaxID=2905687 RepID=A0A9E8G9F5_9ANNE|nr:cytochrome c oxidase subunit III [Paracanthobdella livanowi]